MIRITKSLKRSFNREEGVALILVLWILVLLTLLITDFAISTRLDTMLVRNYIEEVQSYYLAQAGFNLALAELLEDFDYTYLDEEGNLVLALRTPTEDRPNEPPQRQGIAFGPGMISYTLTDEESKININVITYPRLLTLLEEIGVKDSLKRSIIADSILDWTDTDNLHRVNGAEDDYYEKLSLPYEAKDGRIDVLEELLLIRGITPEIFYGGQDGEETYEGLVNFLTTTGSGLNINTASEVVLRTLYTPERADDILDKREESGGVYSDSHTSRTFTIIATGQIPGSPVQHHIKAVVSRKTSVTSRTITILYWNDNYSGR
jgi:general secretion pathway protein K